MRTVFFSWTEFSIDPTSQLLRVTTFGIDPYTENDINTDPSVLTRTPRVILELEVPAR